MSNCDPPPLGLKRHCVHPGGIRWVSFVIRYWDALSAAFEETFKTAHLLARDPEHTKFPTQMTAGKRAKNSPVEIASNGLPASSFPAHSQERKLRNATERLHELERVLDKHGWGPLAHQLFNKSTSLSRKIISTCHSGRAILFSKNNSSRKKDRSAQLTTGARPCVQMTETCLSGFEPSLLMPLLLYHKDKPKPSFGEYG